MGKSKRPENYPLKPESLKNIYFAGQRLMQPGGLLVAVETGRMAVQQLCLDTGKVFKGSAAVQKIKHMRVVYAR